MDGSCASITSCSTGTVAVSLFLAACGWILARRKLPASPPSTQPGGVVFVANGAGDFRCTTKQLEEAIQACGLPVRVETVLWSHGHGRIFADQVDQVNARQHGQLLACQVTALCQECPGHAHLFLGRWPAVP